MHEISNDFPRVDEICPEMHANEMHEMYDRHHKVSPTLNSYQNTNNSARHEVMKTTKRSAVHKVHKIRVRCISGHKCS